jgi:hypothetical protein
MLRTGSLQERRVLFTRDGLVGCKGIAPALTGSTPEEHDRWCLQHDLQVHPHAP